MIGTLNLWPINQIRSFHAGLQHAILWELISLHDALDRICRDQNQERGLKVIYSYICDREIASS